MNKKFLLGIRATMLAAYPLNGFIDDRVDYCAEYREEFPIGNQEYLKDEQNFLLKWKAFVARLIQVIDNSPNIRVIYITKDEVEVLATAIKIFAYYMSRRGNLSRDERMGSIEFNNIFGKMAQWYKSNFNAQSLPISDFFCDMR